VIVGLVEKLDQAINLVSSVLAELAYGPEDFLRGLSIGRYIESWGFSAAGAGVLFSLLA
jgi:hypothetical protein